MQTAGRGICGASQWSAARETARRASKLDEEGLEVVVCRHGLLLKALNMYSLSTVPAEGAPSSHKWTALLHGYCMQVLALPREVGSLHVGTQTFTADETIPFCHACQGSFNQV